MKELFELFITFFVIGITTFGGGQVMIPHIKDEVVDKKHWISNDELLDMVAISEATPGPIVINLATFIGYKRKKVLGSVFATLGVVLPSLIIILIISLFYDKFINNIYVKYAFIGIKSGVAFLIIKTGINFFKRLEKKSIWIILFSIVLLLFILFEVLSVNVSSIYFIILGALVGLMVYFITNKKRGKTK